MGSLLTLDVGDSHTDEIGTGGIPPCRGDSISEDFKWLASSLTELLARFAVFPPLGIWRPEQLLRIDVTWLDTIDCWRGFSSI